MSHHHRDWPTAITGNVYTVFEKSGWIIAEMNNGLSGAGVLIMDANGQIVLNRSYRVAVGRDVLEIPRGASDPGEDHRVTAAREAHEETGIYLDADSLIDLGTLFPDTGFLATQAGIFAAILDHPFGPFKPQPGEVKECVVMGWEEFLDRIKAGEIKESFTLAAALRLKLLIDNGEIKAPEVEIEIMDESGRISTTLKTNRPHWSFEEFTRNRPYQHWSWRFKAPDPQN